MSERIVVRDGTVACSLISANWAQSVLTVTDNNGRHISYEGVVPADCLQKDGDSISFVAAEPKDDIMRGFNRSSGVLLNVSSDKCEICSLKDGCKIYRNKLVENKKKK